MKTVLFLAMVLALSPAARAEGEVNDDAGQLREAGAALLAGETGKAEALYLSALESTGLSKKQRASAHYNLATLYMSTKQPEQAIRHFDQAIELFPEFPEAYYGRGNYRTGLKDYRAAIADYTKALELKPVYQQAYNNRGMCWDRLGEYEKAYADYSKAIEQSGGNYPKAEINRELVAIKKRVTTRHELQL